MDNVYTPDLNMSWDEEEIVPSTQCQLASQLMSSNGASSINVLPSTMSIAMRDITNETSKFSQERNSSKGFKKEKKAKPETRHIPSKNKSTGGQPISPKLFFRSGNWSLKETIVLLDARAKLIEEMKDGNTLTVFKTQDERWEYISQFCVQHGILRSADQCLFRWDRISSTFKRIHDYERHVPSGCDSYWNMTAEKRHEMKLPRSFAEDIYTAMLERTGSDRIINPGNIVYDTSNDMLPDCSSPEKAYDPNTKDDKPQTFEENLSGKKRKRGDKVSILKKELDNTTKSLTLVIQEIDSRRTKHDEDIVELTKAEFEETVSLNRKHIALEEECNKALMRIADAFQCFALHAFSSNIEK